MDHAFSTSQDDGHPGALADVAPAGSADPDGLDRAASLLAGAQRPVIMAGTNVWWGHGETALLRLAEERQIPVLMNGMARGVVPADHPLAFSRARSKALREAVLYLSGANKRSLYGDNFRPKRDVTIEDLIYVSQQVIHNELSVIREQLDRNNVDLMWGAAHFEGPNLLQIQRHDSQEMITGDKFVIATGTRPATPASVPFNDTSILTSDGLLKLKILPKSLIVVGGGFIGVEYACMLGALGVRVTLVEGKSELFEFLDREIAEALRLQRLKTARQATAAVVVDDDHGEEGRQRRDRSWESRPDSARYGPLKQ